MNDTAELIEDIAKALYIASLKRDGYDESSFSWDEQWQIAKSHHAGNPAFYRRPTRAYEDARQAVEIMWGSPDEPPMQKETMP